VEQQKYSIQKTSCQIARNVWHRLGFNGTFSTIGLCP